MFHPLLSIFQKDKQPKESRSLFDFLFQVPETDPLLRWARTEYPKDWEYAYHCLKNNLPIDYK